MGLQLSLEVEVYYISLGLYYFSDKTNTAQETRADKNVGGAAR